MMNQSASATRRPSGSTATAGCCPMLVHPQFFVNPFPTQTSLPPPPAAQQCLHTRGAQALPLQLPTAATTNAPQVNQPTTTPVSNSNGVATNPTVSANIANTNGSSNNNHLLSQNHQQPSQQQPQASRQDHSNYSTSLSAHPFPLQHLLAGRHPANCMALAAALASASFHQHQQLQQVHQQQLQQAPINHPQPPATNVTSTGGPLATPPTSTANQVPLLNFNSYNAAQPFLNIPAPTPLAAHLNLSNNHHQQQPTNTINSANSNAAALSATQSNNNTGNQTVHQPIGGHRPLATNTTLNSAANQQPTNYRTAPQPQQAQQQQPQLNLAGRNLLNDEALSALFTEHFQAIILNQLIGNPQFAPSVVPVPPINSSRPQQHVSPTPSGPTVAPPAQSQPANQSATSGNQQQQPTDTHVVDQQQAQQQPPPTFQSVSQPTAQARMAQALPMDTYSSSTTNTDSVYQQQTSEPVTLQAQQPPQQQQQQQQQPQPIPPIPFYSFPQMEQALALLTNPQVANNLFSQVFNIYLQSGLRSESHHTHHHHHQPHHYHHHLHGSHHHHHHHHGPNGQNNGQDDTMLTISESKPRGLNRAEIDSLTPYIQMNEKDSRTCVICLSRFELKSKIRPLPCNHAFHAKCVDKWLRANRTCPICRRDALKTYGAKIKRI